MKIISKKQLDGIVSDLPGNMALHVTINEQEYLVTPSGYAESKKLERPEGLQSFYINMILTNLVENGWKILDDEVLDPDLYETRLIEETDTTVFRKVS